MALVNLRWFSIVLGKQVETNVIVPEHYNGRCATFYLLHGLSDDSTMWLRRTTIELDVAGLPLIVVMPDGARGFYTDNDNGPAYGRHVGVELVDMIDRLFPTIATREKRSIGGLSMGGYGALRTALAYPERFVSANSHSGALGFGAQNEDDGPTPNVLGNAELQAIFGRRPRGTPHDLGFLAARVKAGNGPMPKLLIDCGTEDFLHKQNLDYVETLKRLDVPHLYREFPGTHSWDYWNEHIKEAIAFHCEAMDVAKAG
jgi:putative tributyrin esterase